MTKKKTFLVLGIISLAALAFLTVFACGQMDDMAKKPSVPLDAEWLDLVSNTEKTRLTFTFDKNLTGPRVIFEPDITHGPFQKQSDTGVYGMNISGIPDGTAYIRAAVSATGTSFAPSVRILKLEDGSSVPDGYDIIPPGAVTDFAGAPGDATAILNWTDPPDDDLAGVSITFTPLKAGVDQPIVVSAGSEAVTVSGLENDVEYSFTAVAVDSSGNKGEPASVTVTPRAPDPEDTEPPAPVTLLTGVPGVNRDVTLSWTNPADTDLSHVHITWLNDGSEFVYDILASTTYEKTINNLEEGTPYTFTVVAVRGRVNRPDREGVGCRAIEASPRVCLARARSHGMRISAQVMRDFNVAEVGIGRIPGPEQNYLRAVDRADDKARNVSGRGRVHRYVGTGRFRVALVAVHVHGHNSKGIGCFLFKIVDGVRTGV
jgi:hypothetical protein